MRISLLWQCLNKHLWLRRLFVCQYAPFRDHGQWHVAYEWSLGVWELLICACLTKLVEDGHASSMKVAPNNVQPNI